jgi:hypothetical protein
MPDHPMPVPPVFQPELAAKAIAYLARRPRRNIWVGVSTAYTILGERLGPKLVGFYLSRTGVKGQQTDRDLPRWGSNLFEPRDEETDRGAHGGFDDMAHSHDPLLEASMRRAPLLAAGAAVVGAATAALLRRRS